VNIAFVNPEYPSKSGRDHGGIATYIYCMANALAGIGHTVHIVSKANTAPDSLLPGIFFHTFTHTPVPRFFPWKNRLFPDNTIWERGYSRAARNAVLDIHKQEPVDIVEIPEYGGLAYAFDAPLPFPVVIHFHTPTEVVDFYNAQKATRQSAAIHAFEANALTRATMFRSPSMALKHDVCKRYGLGDEQITFIPHPVQVAPFDAIKKLDNKIDSIDILFTGRLERRKGGDILCRNIPRLLNADPRINITIAGELDMGEAGSYRSAIERSLSEDQRHRVWLLGPLAHRDLAVIYRRSDIFLMPSLFENAPYALLEAMAAHLPVIGANTSGIAELLRHNENGLLFDIDNEDGVVACVKILVDVPQKAAAYTDRAYNDILRKHDPALIARMTSDFFASVIAKQK